MSLREFAIPFPPIPPFDGEGKSHRDDVRLPYTAEEAAMKEVRRHLAHGKTRREAYKLAGLPIPDEDDYSDGGTVLSGGGTPSSFKP